MSEFVFSMSFWLEVRGTHHKTSKAIHLDRQMIHQDVFWPFEKKLKAKNSKLKENTKNSSSKLKNCTFSENMFVSIPF